MKWIYSAAFVACIIGANVALVTFGVVPVGFGLVAPAGVYFAGATFGFRDAAQEAGGRLWTLSLIGVGVAVSALVDPTFALASGLAFGLSELADFAVYTPLRNRNWPVAVAASNLVGSIVDSAVFLLVAFGSVELIAGQVVGKMWMTALALPVVYMARRKRAAQ
jgi:uncharacterized PurR-regulated membrane protein YhhQ (DUF165 family)